MKFIFSLLICTSAFAQETLPMNGRKTQDIQVAGASKDNKMKITFHVMKKMGDGHQPSIHIQVPDCEHTCFLAFDKVVRNGDQKETLTTLGMRDNGTLGLGNSGKNGIVKIEMMGHLEDSAICWKNFWICPEYKAMGCRPLNDYYYEWNSKTGDAFTSIPLKTTDLIPKPKDHAKICAAFAGS